MNFDAAFYAKSNVLQRLMTKKVLDEFVYLLQWRKDGYDSVLDIGCGSGDVTVEVFLPVLPPTFSRLIGCDLCENMIKYATQHYRQPKVTFERLDITESVDELLTKFGPFDHIISFHCLHWVQNQMKAISNIQKLLTPNGDCFLLFTTSTVAYTVYKEMSRSERWAQYMWDIDRHIAPTQHIASPVDHFRQIFQSVGFMHINIIPQEKVFTFENYEVYKSK